MATNTEFTIIKGEALSFIIIVKENGTISPLVLAPTDNFAYSLVDKKTNVVYADSVAMTISDAANGEVTGTITAIVSAALPTKRGSAEDGYIPRSNLRLVVKGVTASQGSMTATIEDVYVVVA